MALASLHGVQVPLMGVVSSVVTALDVNRDDDDVAYQGLTLLSYLAMKAENQVTSP